MLTYTYGCILYAFRHLLMNAENINNREQVHGKKK
jgi:hypothetical protein